MNAFVKNGNAPIEQSKTEKAIAALEKHDDTIQQIWGPNYRENPRFHEAVRQVLDGRTPSLVIADHCGR